MIHSQAAAARVPAPEPGLRPFVALSRYYHEGFGWSLESSTIYAPTMAAAEALAREGARGPVIDVSELSVPWAA